MPEFHVRSGENNAAFDSTATLFSHLDVLLGTGTALSVSLPKPAVDGLRGFMELLKRHRIDVVLTADSDPEAADFLAQTLLGAAAGGLGGIVGGIRTLSVLSRAGYLIPWVRWFLTGATLLGLLVGTITGFAVTRMGLRIRFVQAEVLQVDLVPLGA